MSFINDLVSTVTGGKNKSVGANPNIQNFQDTDAYLQSQAGVNNQLGNQQTLQNALKNQVNAQVGLQGQLAQQGGLGNQSSVFNQQQALANQLSQQAQGGGPNPAQAMLANQTGANVANQAALMASQRGAGANPALLARQAAQQGAATQQQAVGQGAALQAQQQLAAQQQLQSQQQAMAGLANTQAGQQIQNQQQLANQALQNQQGLTNSNLNNQNAQLGAIGNQNQVQAGITNQQQAGQNALNQQTQKMTGDLIGSVVQAIPGIGKSFKGAAPAGGSPGGLAGGFDPSMLTMVAAKGGEVPNPMHMPAHMQQMASLYHDHSFGNPPAQMANKMAYGGETNVGSQLQIGGKVPGQAKVAGDSETNDTVNAKLSPGEVVIPRSVMQSEDPVSAAAQFVAGLQKKKGSDKPESDFKEALKRAIAGRKSK